MEGFVVSLSVFWVVSSGASKHCLASSKTPAIRTCPSWILKVIHWFVSLKAAPIFAWYVRTVLAILSRILATAELTTRDYQREKYNY